MARTILCYGDSNTHGTTPMVDWGDNGRFGPAERWPTRMQRALGDGWHLVEEGHPGRTTVHDDPIEGPHRNGLTVLPSMLESHNPVDVVVLMLGTNDLKRRFSLTPTDIALSLEKLIAVIRQYGRGPGGAAPGILLVAPPPILETGKLGLIFEGGQEKSHHLADAIAGAAARAGVAYLDAGVHIEVSPVDGIHYDAATHATLGAVMAAAVRQYFERGE